MKAEGKGRNQRGKARGYKRGTETIETMLIIGFILALFTFFMQHLG